MARPKNQAPVYKLHKTTGLARCWVNGKWITLGKYGSPESRNEFARVCAEHAAGLIPKPSGPQVTEPRLTVDQLCLRYLEHAKVHYRTPDGKQTDEVREIKRSMVFLHKTYGHTAAREFGPLALAAIRQEMISANWCRTLINRRVDRLKRAFKWATSQELIPVSVYEALRTLTGLQEGRTTARESEPVKPVPLEVIQASLPHMCAQVRAMVELQLYTGMRPGEACAFSMDQVVTDGELWLYKPRQHKTKHRGKSRVIPIGPKARQVLEAFMKDRDWSATAPLFSPAQAEKERFATARAKAKCDWPMREKAKKRKRGATRDRYSVVVYDSNVRRAAKRAGVASWAPNQLRHTKATDVRRQFGIEAAGAILGHSKLSVTEIYAERDTSLALKVAREVG
ncbi:site-specific integrase [Gemmata sp. G18]|uniref:Site-specific integrase n=1 Tax=Gemmata palustris TaxID=2822762 RepID=A0ABS5BRV7_9BACT|nr:site-specific integrase [Gemmata palustris]MBP3956451.1 site-specific integrase [Gemmata palustris]